MTRADTSHPDPDQVRQFGRGELPDDQAHLIESHVVGCDQCTRILAQLPDDTLVGLLRKADTDTGRATTPAAGGPPAGATATAVAQALQAVRDGTPPPADPATVPPALQDHPRYRVVRLLGRGGMGSVYLAEHRHMGRPVALKVIKPTLLDNAAAVRRFRQEVRAVGRLAHPNIVHAHDAEESGGGCFLVMEYVEGTSLADWLARHGQLPAAEACACARQVALGLQAAHEQGLVHRDIKPQNLMRTPDGVVKILDFGLARVVREEAAQQPGQLTGEGAVMGTADFIAPEQAQDSRRADIRADLYSLGCTLYHLLSGRVPFPEGSALDKILRHATRDPEPLSRLCPDLPAALVRVVERMMAKAPADRYQTPAEVAAALEPFARTAAPGATRPGLRRRVLTATATALLLAGAAVAAAAVYRIATDQGELVITADSDDVEVVIKQGGREVRVVDTKTDRSITLRSGTYDLGLKGAPEGVKLDTDTVTLTRGQTVLAKVERRPRPAAEPLKLELVQRIPFPAAGDMHYDLAVSRGGKYALVTRDIAPGVEMAVFDVKTGDKLFTCPGYKASFLDGEQLVVEGESMFRVYEARTGKLLREGAHDEFWGMSVAPDGKHLAYHNSKAVVLFDLTHMKELHAWQKGPNGSNAFEFSPDGKRLVLRVDGDGPWQGWDVENNRPADDFAGLTKEPWLRFGPGGKTLLSARDGQFVRLDPATGKVVATLRSEELPPGKQGFATLTTGRYVLAGFDDGTVRLFPLATAHELARYQFPADDRIVEVGYHARVATSDDDAYAAVVTRQSLWVFRLPRTPTGKDRP